VARGHDVTAFVRERSGVGGRQAAADVVRDLAGAHVRVGEVTNAASIAREGFRGESFDAVISCVASRTGAAADATRVDYDANCALLAEAKAAGVRQFVLVSAICVQKPRLAFQHAKLAFERVLRESELTHSIVRPTAFFKSLSGQVERVKAGKPFLVFGDGEATACKPISERDLARFVAECLVDPRKKNAILPVGGPGPALTPKAQGALLFEVLGRPSRYRSVPVALLDAVAFVLNAAGRLVPAAREKAEFARIGRYYATESMLVWDEARGCYDADGTPSYGTDTLRDAYARMVEHGVRGQELGDHAVFSRTPAA
jgi:divinyl chlorophyllide a 8-vinyl-reductase